MARARSGPLSGAIRKTPPLDKSTLMDAIDFISLAGKLVAANAHDAACRTAVSRAYYGVFHLAKDFLTELGFPPPRTANVHVFVQHCLMGSGQSIACTAASLLSDLHAARNRADYQLSNHTIGKQPVAMLCLETAHEIRTSLLKCAQSPTKEQIHAGITTYLRRVSRPPELT